MKHFKNIAKIIKETRTSSGLSQEGLSHLLGYKNGQFVSNVERGLCSIPANKIPLMAEKLQIDPEVLIDAIVADKYAELRGEVAKYEASKLHPDIFAKFKEPMELQ